MPWPTTPRPTASRPIRAARISTQGAQAQRRRALQGGREDQRRGILRQRGVGSRRSRQGQGSLRKSADDQAERQGRAVFQRREERVAPRQCIVLRSTIT